MTCAISNKGSPVTLEEENEVYGFFLSILIRYSNRCVMDQTGWNHHTFFQIPSAIGTLPSLALSKHSKNAISFYS